MVNSWDRRNEYKKVENSFRRIIKTNVDKKEAFSGDAVRKWNLPDVKRWMRITNGIMYGSLATKFLGFQGDNQG